MRHLGLIAAFFVLPGLPALGQSSGSPLQAMLAPLPHLPGAPSSAWGDSGSGTAFSSSRQPRTWQELTLDAAAVAGLGAAETRCTLSDAPAAAESDLPARLATSHDSCLLLQNPLRPFVTPPVQPLNALGKLHLAVHDLIHPGNLAAVAGYAVYTVATDAHGPYGPGFNGFRRNAQVSLAGEAGFELIGTFGICSLAHQDPRYFRMPQARPMRRLLHAVAHIAVAQSDSGRPMPNLENLVTSYATAELANLYVPGIDSSAAATNRRILTGLATEPIGNILAEFLPDLASHLHVHILLMQRLLNQMTSGQPTGGAAFNNPTPL
jgi:hypothetical protein